jgi:hypothetical protein
VTPANVCDAIKFCTAIAHALPWGVIGAALRPLIAYLRRRWISENSKANRIETMKGPAESGEICSVEVDAVFRPAARWLRPPLPVTVRLTQGIMTPRPPA